MTNKKAINWLGLLKQRDIEFDDYSEDTKELREKAIGCFQEALNLGIQALEKQKIGYWIENAPEWQNIDPPYVCSECGNFHLRKTNYCDQCGAKMIDLKKSEV